MAIRPFVVIVDSFSDRIFSDVNYNNITLYDYGFLHEVTFFDHVTNPNTGIYSGLGNYDYYEFTRFDTVGGFYEFSYDTETWLGYDLSSQENYDFDYLSTSEFTDAYYNIAYADKFAYAVRTDEGSHDAVGHGDWTLNAFINQLDGTDTHILCVDVDTLNNLYYGNFEHGDNKAHWSKLFAPVQTNMQGAAGNIPALINIVENFYFENDARFTGDVNDDTYLPVLVSASIAGAPASSNEINTFGYIEQQRALIVQAAPNTSQGSYDWGSNYSDVINVGAWNIDSGGRTLISSAKTFDTVDIVANGYVLRSDWENGWTFGTSFATPHVSAEITNLFNQLTTAANDARLSISDLDLSSIDYSQLVAGVADEISTDILVTWENPGYSTFQSTLSLMTDDLNSYGVYPVQVPTTSGLATKVQSVKLINAVPQFTSSTSASVNENISTSTAAYTAVAVDADGDSLTYSISGTDASALTIDVQTGEVTFKSSPNYEDQAAYNFDVTASDGSNSITQGVSLAIIDQNDPAEFRNVRLTSGPHELGDTLIAYYDFWDEDGIENATPEVRWFAKSGSTYSFREQTSGSYTIVADDVGKEIAFSPQFEDDKGNSEQSSKYYFLENVFVEQSNSGPVITSDATVSIAENTSVNTVFYKATATDADKDDITFFLQGIDRDAFIIGSASGDLKFKASPNFEVQPSYSVEIVASDGLIETIKELTINITDANDAAILSLDKSPETLTSGSDVSISISFSDEDGISNAELYLFWYLNDGNPVSPKNVFIGYTSTNGVMTLDRSWAGQNLLVEAAFIDDQNNPEYGGPYNLGKILAALNHPPVVTSDSEVSVLENTQTNVSVYQIQASDADTDTLTYSISGADATALTVNSETGDIYFVNPPNFEDKTSYSLTIGVSDGEETNGQDIVISILNMNEGRPQITSSESVAVSENSPVKDAIFTVSASDIDNDPIRYHLFGDDASAFRLDASSGDLYLKKSPDFEEKPFYRISIGVNEKTARNNVYDDTQELTVTVVDVNEAPEISETGTFSLTENVSVPALIGQISAVDPEGQSISYSVASEDISITEKGDLYLDTHPNYEVKPSYSFSVEISDGENTEARNYELKITDENDAPQFTALSASYSIDEDSNFQYAVAASDEDGDEISYAFEGLPSWLSFNSLDQKLTGRPLNDDVGVYRIQITASDDAGAFDTIQLKITVNNTNDAPVFASSAILEVLEGATYSYTVEAKDIDSGDKVSISAPELPSWLSFDEDTNTLSGSPQNAHVGQHSVTLVARDSTGAITEQRYNIDVINVNQPPKITSKEVLKAQEGSNYSYVIAYSDLDKDDTNTVQIETKPDWLSFDAQSQTLSGMPKQEDIGEHTLSFVVSDAAGASNRQSFVITVASVNDRPVITSGASVDVAENVSVGTLIYTASASDPENDPLTFSLSGSDAAYFSIDVKTGDILTTISPDNEHTSTYLLQLHVSDGLLSDQKALEIKIVDVNDLPEFTTKPQLSVLEDANYSYVFSASDDEDGNLSSYSLLQEPSWLSVEQGQASNALTGTPENADVGSHSVVIAAFDSTGAKTEQAYEINVINTNDAPYFLERAYTKTETKTSFLSSFEKLAPSMRIELTDGQNLTIPEMSDDLANYATAKEISKITVQEYGDTFDDISISDVITQIRHIVGLDELRNLEFNAADVDGDGAVAISDVISNLRSIVGLEDRKNVQVLKADGSPITTTAELIMSGRDYFGISDATLSNYQLASAEAQKGIKLLLKGDVDFSAEYTQTKVDVVEENIAVDSVSFRGRAVDIDVGDQISYSLVGADAKHFQLTTSALGDTGNFEAVITFKESPNYEIKATYVFDLIAKDTFGAEARESFIVDVTDENEVPILVSVGRLALAENHAASSEIYTPVFYDEDGDELVISLSGEDKDYFNFENETASISFKVSPDFEAKATYNLSFKVNDGKSESQHALIIDITDENESPTVEVPKALSIAENTSASSPLTTFAAKDPEGAQVTYSISGTDVDAFILLPNGELFLKVPANYEAKSYYDLKLRISDGVNTVDNDVLVNVEDINEVPELTSVASVSVLEGYPSTEAFYQATASDPEGTDLTFGLKGAKSALFRIDVATGELFFLEAVSFGENNNYEVEILASDGTLIATKTLNVTLLDAFPLLITSANSVSVAENANPDVIVYASKLSLSDQTASYSLSGEDAEFFEINTTTGAVKLLSSADYETKSAYKITINASAGNKTASKDVSVFVTNVNDNVPTFVSGTTGSIYEQTDVSKVIYDATAVDSDGDTVTYSVSGTDSDAVEIDLQTGELTLLQAADYSSKTSYTFTIEASDGTFSKSYDVTIHVLNLNDAPIITSSATTTVVENLGTDSIAYQATASDVDGDSLTYAISGQHASSFTIDTATGAVKFTASPDFETQNSYAFDITVSDGYEEYIKSITLTVSDVNEAPVISSGSTGHVAENAAITTTVYEVSASDVDGDTLFYSLTGTDASAFAVDQLTGKIKLKESADYETQNAYSFTLNVSDGELSASKAITIDVWNVNEFAPVITSGDGGSVTEYSPITTPFYDAEAIDGDGDAITFSLSGADARLLSINATTGLVTPLFVPDYDKKTSFSFSVVASDGYLTSSKDITVAITDIDGGRPLTGTSGDDVLLGSSGADTVTTGSGADIIYTFNSEDVITIDGLGDKTINGGGGTDRLVLDGSLYSSLSDFGVVSTVSNEGVVEVSFTDMLGNTITATSIEELFIGGKQYHFGRVVEHGPERGHYYFEGDGSTGSLYYLAFSSNSTLHLGSIFDTYGSYSEYDLRSYDVVNIADYNTSSDIILPIGNIRKSVFDGALFIHLGSGDDALTVNPLGSQDKISLGAGDDTFYVSSENSQGQGGTATAIVSNPLQLDGGDGNDMLSIANDAWSFAGQKVTLNLAGATNFENLEGNNTNNELEGDAGNNLLIGGNGEDILTGFAGDDQLIGDYRGYQYSSFDIDTFLKIHGDGGDGNYQNYGGLASILRGDEYSISADRLLGGDGNDFLAGMAGDDHLNGGLGDDIFTGGMGADLFIIDNEVSGQVDSKGDFILDFTADADVIVLPEGIAYSDLTIDSQTNNYGQYGDKDDTTISYDNSLLATLYDTDHTTISELNFVMIDVI